MIARNQDDVADDALGEVLDGLNRIARDLDAQAYPGQAWPAPSRKRSRRPVGKIAAVLAAAAAVAAMAVCFGPSREPRREPAPQREQAMVPAATPVPGRAPEEVALPRVVLIEDLDSYSIVDLTTGVPLVSFATKDSCRPACVVPVLQPPPSRAPSHAPTTDRKSWRSGKPVLQGPDGPGGPSYCASSLAR